VRLDGDGQHDPADAPASWPRSAGGADYAIGSRFCDRAASSWRPSLFPPPRHPLVRGGAPAWPARAA